LSLSPRHPPPFLYVIILRIGSSCTREKGISTLHRPTPRFGRGFSIPHRRQECRKSSPCKSPQHDTSSSLFDSFVAASGLPGSCLVHTQTRIDEASCGFPRDGFYWKARFETTHMLGTSIASSPLLAEAWRQSAAADSSGGPGIVAQQADDVVYVAFSGLPALQALTAGGTSSRFFSAVPINIAGGGASGGELFSPLAAGNGEPALVHAASLHCFLAAYNTPLFQKVLAECQDRALVFTGRSAGGSVAALAALCVLCLSRSSTSLSPASLLCVTFGSPSLGNEAFARAVLREGWGGRFCHVVSRGDVVPRLLFCPADSVAPELVARLLLTQSGLPGSGNHDALPPTTSKASEELRSFVSMHACRALSSAQQAYPASAHQSSSLYRPFGSHLFCSAQGGAVCVDNSNAVMKLMYLTLSVDSDVEDESLSYGDLMDRACRRSLLRGSCLHEKLTPLSSHDAGIWLALEASGIKQHDMVAREAEGCLRAASTIERIPTVNCANMARKLATVTPFRAQIEWYKSSCDEYMGYYDSFKQREVSKREFQVNMNRMKLARFWDGVLDMLERNQLPHDFLKRHKWVNASQFYKLLVEPLDIAEYYRKKKHKTVGHYMTHGRERRFWVFDQWWSEKERRIGGREGAGAKRSKYAGLTQDSCFWARVEEARDMAERARGERDPHALRRLLDCMNAFDCYARTLIEKKEVSIDVLAERSSYKLWEEEWKRLRCELNL
ncbi:hypothetical protein Taro_014517, partial [Colocasia esculenta]|nr:hypothetical protein [Colocasia esculenta]